ncbi:MAG: hypothetical protein ACR2LX_04575 [Jatrophihabitans sp.]
MRTPTRRLVALLVVLSLVFGLAACSIGGSAKPPNRHFTPRPTTGLGRYLETPPKYSVPGTTSWAKDYTPDLGQFVEHFYGPSVHKRATTTLQGQGLAEIAHIFWITDERVQSDLVLMRFDTEAGATARLRDVQTAASGDANFTSYSIDARGAPTVFYTKATDADGNTGIRAYARWDNTIIEMFVFSQTGLPKILVQRWLTTQIDMLP